MSRDAFPGDDPVKIDGDVDDAGNDLFKPETVLPDSEAVEPELDE